MRFSREKNYCSMTNRFWLFVNPSSTSSKGVFPSSYTTQHTENSFVHSLHPFTRYNCGESLCASSRYLASPLLSSLLIPSDVLLERARTSPRFLGRMEANGEREIPRNFRKLVLWHFVMIIRSNFEFERKEWRDFLKIIINFSLENVYIRCIVLEKVTFFDPLPKNRSNWSLKRSKRDILAAILSRGSRLHRDRVAALNITRVPLKFLKEIVDRVSWLCRSDTTFPPVKSLFAGRV